MKHFSYECYLYRCWAFLKKIYFYKSSLSGHFTNPPGDISPEKQEAGILHWLLPSNKQYKSDNAENISQGNDFTQICRTLPWVLGIHQDLHSTELMSPSECDL